MSNELVHWQKSSFSGNVGPECVELGRQRNHLALRESDAPATVIRTSQRRAAALLHATKSGVFASLTD
ncbi:DUF397 domain-containing protein [Streptomyces sp. JJ66]|uniref:DUF397 domain-containing protein n=1 Tax=Streptomyces sp. JJ66 TaxID=2803843 RepID=UPI001C59F44C|nr:DUF397 domain-containing protein [Streptomyces sp. JJ66]MBW1601479.1 DUF397 domain-containing protein [Streptomyces sp. JJ66]